MLFMISLSTFAAVSLLVIGLTMKSQREIIRERLDQHTFTGGLAPASVELEMARPFSERIILPMLRKLAGLARHFTPSGAIQGIEEKLETGGRPWGLGAVEFMGLKILSIAVFTVLAFLVARFLGDTPLLKIVFFALFVFVGIILPNFMLQMSVNERQAGIRRVLADTLDLLTVSVEAGLGLDGAMQRVVEKFNNPLSDEMNRALQEMQVGKLRANALRDMANRVKVAELTSFVAAICQADQLGVSIAKVLRVQGDTMRTLRSQLARETAAKLPVKMLFPLVFFIFPSIFVVILAPAAIQIGRALGITH